MIRKRLISLMLQRLLNHWKTRRGQSLVEIALTLPILLLLLSGVIEFGFALNQYINIVEAAREGARYGVDGDPRPIPHATNATPNVVWRQADSAGVYAADTPLEPGENLNYDPGEYYWDDPDTGNRYPACGGRTKDYYEGIACTALQAAAPTRFNPDQDDVMITVYRVYTDSHIAATVILEPTWPTVDMITPTAALDPGTSDIPGRWRLWGNANVSQFNEARVLPYFSTAAAGAGVLVVEMWYEYHQVLSLPWLAFLGNPLHFYTYTVIPVPAGEPRPTPTITPTPTNTLTPTRTPSPGPTLTPSDTPTPTWTPTSGSSPTPTNTLTPTPTGTGVPTMTPTPTPTCNVMNVYASVAQVSGWASDDNRAVSSLAVTVQGCDGNPPADLSNYQYAVQVTAQRDGITFGTGAFDGNGAGYVSSSNVITDSVIPYSFDLATGQFIFQLGSKLAGTTTYLIKVSPNGTSSWSSPSSSPTVNFGCPSGLRVPFNGNRDIQVLYTHPGLAGDRRLTAVTLQWPGGHTLITVNLGGVSNIIWSAGSSSVPIIINSSDWSGDANYRIIAVGQAKPLGFNFDFNVAASGTYTLTARWADAADGGFICTAAPVTVNP